MASLNVFAKSCGLNGASRLQIASNRAQAIHAHDFIGRLANSTLLRGLVTFFLACAAELLISAVGFDGWHMLAYGQQISQPVQMPEGIVAYLLVIDHSGSMNTKMPNSNRTRWQEMQQQAIDLVRNIPLGSRLWIAVFSSEPPKQAWMPPLTVEADRAKIIEHIQNGFGSPNGETALYDTLGMAFEEAERLSQKNPNQYIAVLCYTDGEDNRSKAWNPEKLQERFHKLVNNNNNVWLFYTRIPGEGKSLDKVIGANPRNASEEKFYSPLPLKLLKNQFILPNPRLDPRNPPQKIRLEFLATTGVWDILQKSDHELSFTFQPDPNQPIRVRAEPVVLRRGGLEVELIVENPDQLSIDEEYTGNLIIYYPELPAHRIFAPHIVRLVFQKGERIQLIDRRPADGSTFAVNTAVFFHVNVVEGVKVLWDFGDGNSESGPVVRHTYRDAGKYQVKITAGEPPLQTIDTFDIEIIDIGVNLMPVTQPLFVGHTSKLEYKSRGPIQRYELIIDSRAYEGKKTVDHESTFEYTFDTAGRHSVQVKAYSPKTVVFSDEIFVNVLPKPEVSILEPLDNSILHFNKKGSVKIEVQGPVDKVACVITDGNNSKLFEKEVPVPRMAENGAKQITLDYTAEEPQDEKPFEATLSVVGILPDNYKDFISPPNQQIKLRLQYAPLVATLRVTSHDLGTAIPFSKQPVVFEVEGSDILTQVTWYFRERSNLANGQATTATHAESPAPSMPQETTTAPSDATLDGMSEPEPQAARSSGDKKTKVQTSHVFKKVGQYEVKAVVSASGARRAEDTVTVTVAAQRPEAKQVGFAVGGKSVERLYVGDTIQLQAILSGDVAESYWQVNGAKLSGSTFVPEKPGEYTFTFVARGPEGVSDLGGNATVEKVVTLKVYKRPNHWLFGSIVCAAVMLFTVSWRFLTRNEPRYWYLYYCPQRPPTEYDARQLLKQYWSRWHKCAKVPMRQLLGAYSEYWASGEGSREYVIIRPLRGRAKVRPVVQFSGEGNDRVDWSRHMEDKQRVVYSLLDRRCKEPQFQNVFFELFMATSWNPVPIFLLISIGVALVGICSWTYYQVYQAL